jgi:hypothetical protein
VPARDIGQPCLCGKKLDVLPPRRGAVKALNKPKVKTS